MTLKLDLGAGAVSPEGFTPLGRPHGSEIYPLPYADDSVDEIRASHCLEHFGHRIVPDVLKDWVRALKPGGMLNIAVPDFGKIAENYVKGVPQNTEGYLMGGQTDADDFHKAQFDGEKLKRLLAAAGLALIREWRSELEDCAALPISLNLGGTKPHQKAFGVSAVMSMPRLTWTENSVCVMEALNPLSIRYRSVTGAYWGQCLERGLEQALREDAPDAVLTIDYDSIFRRREVSLLMQLMMCHPEADAIAPVQAMRGADHALFAVEDGGRVSRDIFEPDLFPITTAHFGLTLIRASKLVAFAHPWFLDVPAPDGSWGDGRKDADIDFWLKWKAAGNTLFLANRVCIGHLDITVTWPGEDFRPIHQPLRDWRASGPPKEVWK
jgi:hypothetical protein